MGWVEGFFSFKEATKIEEMSYEIYDDFENERGRMDPVNQKLILLDKVFASIEDADAYLNSSDVVTKYHRRNNIGVKYKDYSSVSPTKKYLDLENRIKDMELKIKVYTMKHSIATFKAEFIGCPDCKSKLKKELLRSHRCPLCSSDMRSETTKKTLSNYQVKLKELNKNLLEEKKKQSAKAKLMWRVSAQAYLG